MPKITVKWTLIGLTIAAIIGGSVALLKQSALNAQTSDKTQRSPTARFNLNLIEVASGLNKPVQVTHAGDGSNRLFVVDQRGYIRIIQNGAVLSTPFLDIDALVRSGGERGLLGLAFHPQYVENGYFYVDYTDDSGNTVIARYSVSADPNLANPDSALILMTIPQPYRNHNGGQVAFGPDGYLYIGMGDGGGAGDPQNNGQDKNTLLGAMLRIDVDHTSGSLNYAIPADNPFVGQDGADEIWAIGLRNPWRFSFDRRTGDLYIGDVGQNKWEEINYQAAGTPGGLNFGWDCKEGTHAFNSPSPLCGNPVAQADLVDPIAEYSHAEGFSVTGGFVYRGSSYSAMSGYYFYADYGTGKIWSLTKTGANPDTWSAPELELDTNFNISAFGEDESGELYVIDYSAETIYKLANAGDPHFTEQPTKRIEQTGIHSRPPRQNCDLRHSLPE